MIYFLILKKFAQSGTEVRAQVKIICKEGYTQREIAKILKISRIRV